MDLNADGNIDILSGSYSRQDRNMAGLFQVLWGNKDGTFRPAEVLKGTDGEPLIITTGSSENEVTDRICTRPFACDLNGDGKLDIVSGNFAGSFAYFVGEGGGRFAPKSTMLAGSNGGRLSIRLHSDPFLIDWDGDGDLDLVTGSAAGGAFLFENLGSATEPRFGESKTLVAPVGHGHDEARLGDAHVTGPQGSTRVWVDDLNADGKLDLLIGDSVRLAFPAEGVDEADARKQLVDWTARQQRVLESQQRGEGEEPSEQEMKEFQIAWKGLQEERKNFVRDESTGFVWVFYGK